MRAKLEVPPGAVAQPTTFGIERVDAPPPPPFDMSFVGPVFRFTPADAPLQQPLSITVPRTDAARGGLLRFEAEFDEFVLIEACGVSDTHLQQYVWQLNTFSAARYIGDLPPSTQGLGDGTVAAVVDGVPRSYSVDEPASWAIYRDQPDGGRLVTLYLMREPAPGGFERLRMDFSVNAADATCNVVQVDLLSSVGAGGTYIDGIMGSASITFGDLSDGRVRANVDATLASGQSDVALQATFDIGVERFIFPPELSCPRPD